MNILTIFTVPLDGLMHVFGVGISSVYGGKGGL